MGLFGSSLAGVSGCRLMVPGRVRVWPGPRCGRHGSGAGAGAGPGPASSCRRGPLVVVSAEDIGPRRTIRRRGSFGAKSVPGTPPPGGPRRSRVLVARCLRVRALASAWVLLRSAGPASPALLVRAPCAVGLWSPGRRGAYAASSPCVIGPARSYVKPRGRTPGARGRMQLRAVVP